MSVALRWKATRWDKGASIMCRLFGHIWEGGWYGDRPYFRPLALPGNIDGIGREHVTLTCQCMRCGYRGHVGYVHNWNREMEKTP